MTEREKFEAWFKTSGFWNDAITWKAWQAALESRVLAERKPIYQERATLLSSTWFDVTLTEYRERLDTDGPDWVRILFTHPAPDDEKDAARYRWLREGGQEQEDMFGSVWADSLDAAIDRAMQDKEKQG